MPPARVQPKPAVSARGDISDAHVRLIESRVADAVNAFAVHRPENPVEFIGYELLRRSATSALVPVPRHGFEPPSAQSIVAAPEETSASPKTSSDTTEDVRGTQPSKQDAWTVAKWLGSTGFNATVGKQLVTPEEAATHGGELKAMRHLFGANDVRAAVDARLRAAHELIVDQVTRDVEALVAHNEVTPEQMQGKFLQEGASMMDYGNLSSFFGGLEGKIGGPNPKVYQTMASEHTAKGGDRHEHFTTGNYGVTTTSAIEWAFVATPDERPVGDWPRETRLGGKAERRESMPLAELERLVAEHASRLRDMGEEPLLLQEALGARLYTGPLFVKYNAVLRGLESEVDFLRNQMVQLCCPKVIADDFMGGAQASNPAMGSLTYAGARKELNTYTTTLHAINSSIIKLSKLTVATKVYRGVSGLALPDEFWTANKFGVKGGVEGGFMSTTLERDVAMAYAAGDGAGFIFEMTMGMVDRGADIGFLSQYPHEREILFAPLTGLEVRGTRIDGAVLVVEVALSINLASLTIEQVIGKRKKMLQDMVPGLEAELRLGLEAEGVATREARDGVVSWLRPAVEKEENAALAHEAEWYNDDDRLSEALQALLRVKRELDVGGVERVRRLAERPAEELKGWGFGPAEAYTAEVAKVLRELEDADGNVRAAAVEALGKLPAEALATHALAVVAKLEDAEGYVRKAAVSTLGKLPAEALVTHAPAVVAKLEDTVSACAVS